MVCYAMVYYAMLWYAILCYAILYKGESCRGAGNVTFVTNLL